MINAELPVLPTSGTNIELQAGGLDQTVPRLFSSLWYRFFAKLMLFLQTLMESPQQIEQGALSLFSSKLGPDQVGLTIWIPAPYDHLLVWDGAGWTFGPGDAQSGFTVPFLAPPTGDGWAQCAGQTISFLKADGALGSQALPTTAGLYFRR